MVAKAKQAEAVLTADEAAAVLGVTRQNVYSQLRRLRVPTIGTSPGPTGRPLRAYRKADVLRVAAGLNARRAKVAGRKPRGQVEEERAVAATLSQHADSSTVHYGHDRVEIPQVQYGLLDYHDARALAARRARYPDWRPRVVA